MRRASRSLIHFLQTGGRGGEDEYLPKGLLPAPCLFLKVRIGTGTSWRWFYRKLPLMTIFWRCRLVPNLKDKVGGIPGLYSSYYLLHTYIIQIDIGSRIIYFFVAFPTWEFVNSSLNWDSFCLNFLLKLLLNLNIKDDQPEL